MLLARYTARDKDPEVTDAFVNCIDNSLPVGANFIGVLIDIENPAQRLLRRRNVVAF